MDNSDNTLPARLPYQAPTQALPARHLARTLMWLLAGMLLAGTWLLGGIEAATILLATQIGALALFKPKTALWAVTTFLVFLFVFFQGETIVTPRLPLVFIYWGIGVAIITGGLCLAWLPHRHRILHLRKPTSVVRFDRIMLTMLALSLLASAYGLLRGNNWFAVARQLFGCLLLPGYYLFAQTFFCSAADIHQWMKRASAAVTAGAAWYTAKIIFLSFSEGAFTPVQSPISFYAGVIGAVLFADLLWEQPPGKRTRMGLSLLFCILAILLTGARFVAGSLAGTALIMLVLRRRKRRLLTGFATLGLLALATGFVLARLPELIEQGGLYAGIATRFSPLDLSEDWSYLGRMAQMQSVLDTVKQQPILGGGMGAEISSYTPAPDIPLQTAVYVDNGWGFILLKMGLLGPIVFIVMLWRFLKFAAGNALWNRSALVRQAQFCLLAILLFGVLSFIGGPTFFEFLMSGFMGTTLGALAVLADLVDRKPLAPQSKTNPAPMPCA